VEGLKGVFTLGLNVLIFYSRFGQDAHILAVMSCTVPELCPFNLIIEKWQIFLYSCFMFSFP
jgi:hypothetical protein